MNIISEELRDIATKISNFYLEKYNGDYKEAAAAVSRLKVHDVQIPEGGGIKIILARPGFLIGRKGENLEKLSAYLGAKIFIEECHSWTDLLTPLDYSEY